MNNKKTIIILILVLFIGIIGLTVAYFSNSTTLDNLFSTKEYGSTITETFTSPNNWLPGDVTEKKVVATNTGEVDQAVRISYTEKWLDSNNNELNGWIHEDGTKSNHETELELNTDERVALINFDNNDDWTYNNGYYYYNYRLQPNESTSSLIKSVSFNSKTKLDDTCTTTIGEGKKTITCNSSGDNYDGATYTLTFIIETVQFDKYMSAWNTDVAILNEQSLFCDAIEVGEVVEYNNAEYYVLKDSSTRDDYVTLLKKNPLTASEVNQYSTDYVSQDGEYPYYESDTCNENNQTGCSTNYDTSDVKKIVDRWSSSFNDDLVSIDGYKTRLIGEDDITFEKSETISEIYYNFSTNTPVFVHNSNDTYWTMIISEDSLNQAYRINYGISVDNIYNKSYIRPIINLKKIAIGSCYVDKYKNDMTCNKGEEVIYNNEKYNVLSDSANDVNYVTLLKKDFLTAEEINEYSSSYVSQNGEYPYYESDTCNLTSINNYSGCNNNYDTSNVKYIIDSWSSEFISDLKKVNGYKARLLNEEEVNENFVFKDNNQGYTYTSNTPSWFMKEFSYWTMFKNYETNIYQGSYGFYPIMSRNTSRIRPVINLFKDSIESGCGKGTVTEEYDYHLGEEVNYNNSAYCVIDDSKTSDDYVTLIKKNVLTYDELETYNNGYEITEKCSDHMCSKKFGLISYYESDTCNSNKTSGCTNNYDDSFVKNVVNNWSNPISSDLKEIDGYKARLINFDEMSNIGYVPKMAATTGIYYETSEIENECLKGDASFWSMVPTSDDGRLVGVIGHNAWPTVCGYEAIRPVINLKKCALTNTCE